MSRETMTTTTTTTKAKNETRSWILALAELGALLGIGALALSLIGG